MGSKILRTICSHEVDRKSFFFYILENRGIILHPCHVLERFVNRGNENYLNFFFLLPYCLGDLSYASIKILHLFRSIVSSTFISSFLALSSYRWRVLPLSRFYSLSFWSGFLYFVQKIYRSTPIALPLGTF